MWSISSPDSVANSKPNIEAIKKHKTHLTRGSPSDSNMRKLSSFSTYIVTDSLLEEVICLEVKLTDYVDQIRQMETQTRLVGGDQ